MIAPRRRARAPHRFRGVHHLMSAFLCSENHLSLIANAASTEPVERDNAFALLVAENLRSLFARYPSDHEDHVARARCGKIIHTVEAARGQHRDDGRGRCIDCGEFI